MSSEIITILATVVCLVLLWIKCRKHRMSLFRRYGIPGPKPNFLSGNINEYNTKRNECIEEWIKEYGTFFGFFFGGKPYIVSYDTEFLKTIEIKDFKKFTNKDLILPDASVPHKLTRKMVELEVDDEWKNSRAILSKSFTSGKIKMMSTLMIEPINIFKDIVAKKAGKPFDIFGCYNKLTFDIICRTEFGISSNVQKEETNKFIQSIQNMVSTESTNILTIISIFFPEFEPLPTIIRRFSDYIKNVMNFPSVHYIFQTSYEIIKSRKTSQKHWSDLLQIMIEAEDNEKGEARKLTIDEVIANAVFFFIVGNESTAATSSWCTYYMAIHDDIQEKVRQEINENIERNEEIQYSDLDKLKYMEQVISETLRFRSFSIFLINRISSEEFKYKDITIPKDVPILVPVPCLNMDPKYWHEPTKFDPDRFSPENRMNIDPIVYQPFGAGPRVCLGKRLAMAIMKLILANVIRSFKLEYCGEKNMEVNNSLFTSHPKNGIMVKAIPLVH